MDKSFVHNKTSYFFRKLGNVVSKRPVLFILVPILITASSVTGFLWIKGNRDAVYLFSPKGSRSLKDRATIEALFPMNNSHDYSLYKATRTGSHVSIIMQAKDGDTMLRKHIFKEIIEVDRIVRETRVLGNVSYDSICARNDLGCYDNEPLLLAEKIQEFQAGKFRFRYPIDIHPLTFKVTPYVLSLGRVSLDQEGYVSQFGAFRLFYMLDDASGKKELVDEWEKKVYHIVTQLHLEELNLYILTTSSFKDELQQLGNSVLPLSGFAVIAVAISSSLVCLTVKLVQSKPWLGFAGCISAGLAVVTAFGFLFLCGVEHADMNMALPFLVIGIGVDDAFVMLSYWRRTHSWLTVSERMENTYSEAAVSITITSLTDILSFAIGIFNPFPIIRIFCTYATVCIFLAYVYQITFFGACMALSGAREEKNLNPFTCRPVLFHTFSDTETDQEECKHKALSLNQSQNNEEFFMKLFRDYLSALIEKRFFKISAVVLYLVILGCGIWNITLLSEGLEPGDILPKNSVTSQFVDRHYKYFTDYPYSVQVVITEPLNYENITIQKHISEVLKNFENTRFTAGENLTQSWLKFYLMFSQSSFGSLALGAFDLTQKQDFIDGLVNVFLKYPQTKDMRKDILLNENSREILASRFFITCKAINDKYQEKHLIEEMRKIVDESPFSMVIHSTLFPSFEQLVAVRSVTMKTVCIATALSLAMFFIFAPSLKAAVTVALTVLTIQVETIGYMSLLGVNLDILSTVMLLMCVGFSINYPSHMAYSYVSSSKGKKISKLKTALYAVVLPICQGSLTTVMGVSILALECSYIFLMFFKIGCLVVFLAAFHSIFIIPVILELMENFSSSKKHLKSKSNEEDASLKITDH